MYSPQYNSTSLNLSTCIRRRTSFHSVSKSDAEQLEAAETTSGAISPRFPDVVPALLPEDDNGQQCYAGPASLISKFCSEPLFNALMQDYIGLLYPVLPVVHLPTFVSDLGNYRHRIDQDFGRFVLALCAVTISVRPDRFVDFKKIDPDFSFSTRLQAIDCVQSIINKTKPPDYYDHSTVEKWAIPLCLGRAYAYLGNRKAIYYHFSEGHALMQDLGCHRTSTYASLDHVEAQLRKKAFWLTAITYTYVYHI